LYKALKHGILASLSDCRVNYLMGSKMAETKRIQVPVLVEKDEDGFYVVECPLLQGCYTQGQTLDEALKNIHEVIELCLEEQREELVERLDAIQEFSYHLVAVEI
jgi:predicted RNase H-like HicB family nuclease